MDSAPPVSRRRVLTLVGVVAGGVALVVAARVLLQHLVVTLDLDRAVAVSLAGKLPLDVGIDKSMTVDFSQPIDSRIVLHGPIRFSMEKPLEVPVDLDVDVPIDTDVFVDQTLDIAVQAPLDVVLTERDLSLEHLAI